MPQSRDSGVETFLALAHGLANQARSASKGRCALQRPSSISTCRHLEATTTFGLGVDVSEASLLLAFLEQTCGGEEKCRIDTGHTERSGEDVVNEDVGETGNGAGAPSHQGGSGRRRAGLVRNKSRRSAVEEATAGELRIDHH